MMTSLPPALAQFIRQEVASGRYQSEDEVVCHGLRLLQERQHRLEELRREIAPALERLDRGEGKELDLEEITRRGMEKMAERDAAE